MKTALGTSPDTSFNSDLMVMPKTDFFKILRIVVQEKTTTEKDRIALTKKLDDSELEDDAKKAKRE